MNERIRFNLMEMLGVLESGNKLSLQQVILVSIVTCGGVNPNKMDPESVKNVIKGLLNDIDKNNNVIINNKGNKYNNCILGEPKSVKLNNSTQGTSYKSMILTSPSLLILAKDTQNIKGDTVLQKLVTLDNSTIRSIIFSLSSTSKTEGTTETEINNLDDLLVITNDQEFVIYIDNMAIIAFEDFTTNEPRYLVCDKNSEEVIESNIYCLSLYLNIE